jgi:predicted AlkP superfamily phosphohydrolase/phosphomutase
MGRAVVIGLDVGDGHLVETWAADGSLPALARLMREGAFGRLETPASRLHVSAWPSLYTGVQPERHGVYYTFQPARGEQGAVRFRPDQYRAPPLWQVLSGAGKRCLVLDAPYTHPVEGAGTQIFEWGTWAHYWEPSSLPADRLGALRSACGAYPLGIEANQIGLTSLDPVELVPKLVESARAKGAAARWLAASEEWDLFLTVFSETHPGAHYLWPEERSARDASAHAGEFARLREVYVAVDAAIGALLDEVEGDAAVFVVSGDGAGPNHAGWHLLPDVLEKLGVAVPPGAPGPEGDGEEESGPSRKPPKTGLYARLRGLVPPGLRQGVSRLLPASVRDALMKKNVASAIDWSRSRAYCLPTDLEGCIRINLRGREPEGIVEPGAEYDALCDELTAAIGELVNPATGAPAASAIARTDPGQPASDALPDLVVSWGEDHAIEELRSPRVGTVRAPSPDERTGTHRPPGFVIARAPGLAAGARLDGADVVDFAPSVLAALGVSPPDDMGGKVWKAGG